MKCSVGHDLVVEKDGVYCAGMDGIHYLPKRGGAERMLFEVDKNDPTGADHAPKRIRVDGDRLYFLLGKADKGAALLEWIAKAGGTPVLLAKVETAEQEWPAVLAMDATDAYVITTGATSGDERMDTTSSNYHGGALLKIPKNGGSVSVLASGVHVPTGLVMDDTNLYFTEFGTYRTDFSGPGTETRYNDDGAIKKIAKSGGEVVTLAAHLDSPTQPRLVGGEIVWQSSGHFTPEGHTWTKGTGSMRLPIGGAAVSPASDRTCALAHRDFCFGLRVEITGTGLYGATHRTYLERWPKAGGRHEVLYDTSNDLACITMADDGLYWLEGVDYRLSHLKD